jgi:hypothetical protein
MLMTLFIFYFRIILAERSFSGDFFLSETAFNFLALSLAHSLARLIDSDVE